MCGALQSNLCNHTNSSYSCYCWQGSCFGFSFCVFNAFIAWLFRVWLLIPVQSIVWKGSSSIDLSCIEGMGRTTVLVHELHTYLQSLASCFLPQWSAQSHCSLSAKYVEMIMHWWSATNRWEVNSDFVAIILEARRCRRLQITVQFMNDWFLLFLIATMTTKNVQNDVHGLRSGVAQYTYNTVVVSAL